VVSAVGHEVDHVLADLAADRRAPTPSAAAELVVPDRAELSREIGGSLDRMRGALGKKVQAAAGLIEDLRFRLQPRKVLRRINEDREEVSEIEEDLNRAVLAKVERGRSELGRQRALLEGRSPLTILSRGYCIAEKDGRIVRSAGEIAAGDRLKLRIHRGGARARVEEVYHDEKV